MFLVNYLFLKRKIKKIQQNKYRKYIFRFYEIGRALDIKEYRNFKQLIKNKENLGI